MDKSCNYCVNFCR